MSSNTEQAHNAASEPASPAQAKDNVRVKWISEFFEADSIVHTMQSLLRCGGHTVGDLCKLCIAAHESDLVPALTQEGLMPFSNNYAYVFRYSDMTKKQIKALIAVLDAVQVGSHTMRCVNENDFYIVPLCSNFIRIQDDVLLFGAGSFMKQHLMQSRMQSNGQVCLQQLPPLEKDRMINAVLFRIVNSCAVKRGALRECMQMLETHRTCI